MNDPCLDEVKEMIVLTTERLQKLKLLIQHMHVIGDGEASALRIALGDVATPLNMAIEIAESF